MKTNTRIPSLPRWTSPSGSTPHVLITKPNRPSLAARMFCTLAGACTLLLAMVPAGAATLTYNFNNGLQGWTQIWPAAGYGNVLENGALGSGHDGGETRFARSPEFYLDGSGALTFDLQGGESELTAPSAAPSAIPELAIPDGGFGGVALRDIAADAYVLSRRRSGNGDSWQANTFTTAELAPYANNGKRYTLDYVDDNKGGWGWTYMDNVAIPGTLVPPTDIQAAPSVTLGSSTTVVVSIPSGHNASSAVTVFVTNSNPGIVTINGSADPVITLTFAAGAASSQNLTVAGISLGFARLKTGCASLISDEAGIAVLRASGLIGRWITGEQDLLDKSGYLPAGTHDGVLSDGLTPAFAVDDVPPGAAGASLDLATSGGAVLVTNTAVSDAAYRPTFDGGVAQQLSVAFWAKWEPGEWNPFVSKWGEGSIGWQVRKRGNQPVATFTVRGTGGEDDPFNGSTLINDGAWHHFVATWDGVGGVRKLYVDGKLNNLVPHAFGPMGLAPTSYLTLGGRSGAGSSSPGNLFVGQLFDVQIYGIPLPGSAVQSLFTANTDAVVAYADTAVVDLGKSGTVSVSIPAAANASSAVTVYVTNTTPAVASLAGAVANVVTLTFPAGGATSQTLAFTGLSEGQAQFNCVATGLTAATVTVQVYGPRLIGRWFNGLESLADLSGFATAGTHDGTEVGGGTVAFANDTPPSKPGKSAQFAGNVGLQINNSSLFDGSSYAPTFDDVIASQFSVSFWAKGIPGTWNAFVSKRGEESIGWQLRRSGDITEAFTMHGTPSGNFDGVGSVAINDGQWHHFAAVWDGYTGTRKCYVDGVLDPSINLTGDFAPMMMAPNHHLVLGAREQGGVSTTAFEGYFSGLLYDVQMFNYPLSQTEVKDLSFIPTLRVFPALRSLHAPNTMAVDIVLPEGANASQAVTVQVLNNQPAIASLTGAVANMVTLNYAVGGSRTQQVTVAGIADGKGQLTASGGGFIAGSGTFNVWADPGNRLIGRWFSGADNLVETSGFRPAGTHDGVAVGANASALVFSSDVPVVAPVNAQSLDLTVGSVAVKVGNSSSADVDYVETFDNQMANKFSIVFWAKGGTPPSEDWNVWVSKRGEDNVGYQVRRNAGSSPVQPAFTIRGTPGDDDGGSGFNVDTENWHHYAATWDGVTGVRKLYVDGNLIGGFTGDFGPLAMATGNYLTLGGLDTGGFWRFFPCLLFDVQVYSYALDPLDIGLMANPPTALSLALIRTSIPLGSSEQLVLTLPASATASTPVTVYLTNNSPTVVSIVGPTAITFPVGSQVQTINLQAIGLGQINISAGAPGVGDAMLTSVNMVVEPKLIGHWLSGDADLLDKSGFTPAGTHDGAAVGPNAAALAFSGDVPAGFTGQSLNLTAGNVGVAIQNSANTDAGYLPTFDNDIQDTFTIAFWAKGMPGDWAGWVSKRGEDGIGWQLRRMGGDPIAGFTLRGVSNDDGWGSAVNIANGQPKWHHFVGVWEQVTGTRTLYVDGQLSTVLNNSTAQTLNLAPDKHLGLGARQGGGADYEGYFSGLLFDVRMYDYPLTADEVAAVVTPPPAPPTLTIQPWTGNQVRISWPTSFTGFGIEQSSSVDGGWGASGLAVTVDGSEYVALAPTSTSPQFFRLKK